MTFKPRMTLAQATQAVCLIGLALVFAIVLGLLTGCATVDEPCALMPVQQTQTTVMYVKVFCVGTGV